MLLLSAGRDGVNARPAFAFAVPDYRFSHAVRQGVSDGWLRLLMACLGCVPIVFIGCLGYTANAPLRHSRYKAVGLNGFETKETQK